METSGQHRVHHDPAEGREAELADGEHQHRELEQLAGDIRRLDDLAFLARYLVAVPRACGAAEAMAATGLGAGVIARAFRDAFEEPDDDVERVGIAAS